MAEQKGQAPDDTEPTENITPAHVQEEAAAQKEAEAAEVEEATQAEEDEVAKATKTKPAKPGSRKRLWRVIASIAAVLIIASAAVWKTGTYAKVMNRYNAASISVRVRESETYALQGVTVAYAGKTYTSDAAGQVNITDATAGTATLTAEKTGYTPITQSLTLVRGENSAVNISLVKEPDQLFAVSGIVTDIVSATALSGAKVVLGNRSVISDAAGGFSFDKVKPGDQKVTVSATGFDSADVSFTVTATAGAVVKAPLAPTGKVLFVSNRDGKRAIYQAAYSGGSQQQLVAPVAATEDFGPSQSPNGQLIIFSSTRDKLAATYDNTYLPRLYIVGADGKGLKKVSDDVSPNRVTWSADSKYIYFEAYSDTKQTQYTYKIYDVAKGQATDLVTSDGTIQNAVLSTKGSLIAFTTHSDNGLNAQGLPLYKYLLHVRDLSKTGELANQELTMLSESTSGISDAGITFNSDDLALTFETQSSSEGRKRYQFTTASKAIDELAPSSETKRSYKPSPDGTRKAFIDTRDGKKDLFTVNASATDEQRLTTLGTVSNAAPITWSASGKYLTFAVVKDGESAIYIVGAAGGEVRKIVDFSIDTDTIPYY